MIKSKLIRVLHNRVFRSKIKHRDHGRRIGSSDICPDVSGSVSCPINFSYTHNTTFTRQYIDTFMPFYQPITQQKQSTYSVSETNRSDRFDCFEIRKRRGCALPFIMFEETFIETPVRPFCRTEAERNRRKNRNAADSQARRFTAGRRTA